MLTEKIETEERNMTSIYDFDSVLLLKLLRIICQHHGVFAPSQSDSKDALTAIKALLSEGAAANSVNPMIPPKVNPQDESDAIMELQALVLAGKLEDVCAVLNPSDVIGLQIRNGETVVESRFDSQQQFGT